MGLEEKLRLVASILRTMERILERGGVGLFLVVFGMLSVPLAYGLRLPPDGIGRLIGLGFVVVVVGILLVIFDAGIKAARSL